MPTTPKSGMIPEIWSYITVSDRQLKIWNDITESDPKPAMKPETYIWHGRPQILHDALNTTF